MQLCTVNSFSQTLTPKEWEDIQKSDNYIIGMGINTSIEEARQSALSDLASKISTKVSSKFNYQLINENKGKAVNSESRMQSVINSYSNVTLKDVSEHVIKKKQEYTVFRYMKVSEMRAMFKRRVELAKKWAKEGVEREKEGRIGDALQSLYWSLALLNSCPDADLETISQDYVETNMDQDIHRRVKEILDGITIKAISVEKESDGQYITLNVLYHGKPAVNFNYKYTDGKNVSEIFTVRNGEGELLIPTSANLRRLKIQAEYECRDEANIHPDVRSVMEFTDPVAFKASIINVDTKSCLAIQHDKDIQLDSAPTACYEILSGSEVSTPLLTMQTIEKGISQKNYQSLKDYFTDEGWKMFDALVHYGNAKLTKAPNVQFLPDKNGGSICRSFPMSFSFKGNKRTFVEDVVFYLNREGKVKEVAFGLEPEAVNDIMGRGPWSQDERQTMIHFLETYKTAYALKRLDYIDAIFSHDALIITGSIVKGTGQREMLPSKMAHVKYTQQTKDQYINNLRKCFASNEFINIHFAENIVRRSSSRPTIYGIQIKQDYFSSTYGDTGYLFLLIDFEKSENPLIHVRTWQPDLDPEIKDGRVDITSFTL